jgi:hypothetical protein
MPRDVTCGIFLNGFGKRSAGNFSRGFPENSGKKKFSGKNFIIFQEIFCTFSFLGKLIFRNFFTERLLLRIFF